MHVCGQVHVTLVELQSCADQVRARLETVEAKQRDLRDRMMKLLQDQETIVRFIIYLVIDIYLYLFMF